jgi:glycosyltransferase involved in cell wall biosynthesis
MKIFWLFRSNLKHLEYYHQYETLEDFEKNCHDFYMLFPIWLLRNNYFDTVVIWRLSKKPIREINFNVNGKLYSQRWVRNFSEVFKYPKPKMTFFRGGFQEYDKVTIQNPSHFGLKLYLATGRRIYPQWDGKYDIFLQEDPSDFKKGFNCLPFYKTASPQIFYPKQETKKYDICWPCNFAQIRYKGQEDFIKAVSHFPNLRKLKIIHCGNKAGIGKKLTHKYNVTNIEFLGEVNRPTLNNILNQSRLGLCMSNRMDGCPRVVTEILMAGTPLIVRDETRLIDYYKKNGIVEVNLSNINKKISQALENYNDLEKQVKYSIKNLISFDVICKKNISRWLNINS